MPSPTDRPVPEDGYHGDYVADVAKQIVAADPGAARAWTVTRRSTPSPRPVTRRWSRTSAPACSGSGVDFDVWFSERHMHDSGAVDAALDTAARAGARLRGRRRGLVAHDRLRRRQGPRARPQQRREDLLRRGRRLLPRQARPRVRPVRLHARRRPPRLRQPAPGDRRPAPATIPTSDPRGARSGSWSSCVQDGVELRLSKRAGTIVTLDDFLDLVGVDAGRYSLARWSADTPLTLDIAEITRRSNDNPVYYVQYAHARTCNARRNAADGRHRSRRVPARTAHQPVRGRPADRAQRVPPRRRRRRRNCARRTASPVTSRSSPPPTTAGTTSAASSRAATTRSPTSTAPAPGSTRPPRSCSPTGSNCSASARRSGCSHEPIRASRRPAARRRAARSARLRRAGRRQRPRPGDLAVVAPAAATACCTSAASRSPTLSPSTARRPSSSMSTTCAIGPVPTTLPPTTRRTRCRRVLRGQGVPVHCQWRAGSPTRASAWTSAPAASSRVALAAGFPGRRGSACTATTSPATSSSRAVAAGVGHIIVDSFDEIDRLAEIAARARGAPAGPRPGDRRRRGAHARVHRDRPRGPEVRLLAPRRRGRARGGRGPGGRRRSSSAACTRTSARRSSTRPASRSPRTASSSWPRRSATGTGSTSPRSTSAAGSASPTSAVTTPRRRSRPSSDSSRSSSANAGRRGCRCRSLSVEPGPGDRRSGGHHGLRGRHGEGRRARRRDEPLLRLRRRRHERQHPHRAVRRRVHLRAGQPGLDRRRRGCRGSSASTARAATSSCAMPGLPGDVVPGDLIAVAATGAYCRSMASNYNLVPRPPVVAVRDGASHHRPRAPRDRGRPACAWTPDGSRRARR